MRRGEIYLAAFPFGDVAQVKLRPVLLLTDTVGTGSEIIAAYISSVMPPRLLETDILLNRAKPGTSRTGLKVDSVLRLHKVATLHRSVLQRRLGVVPPEMQAQIGATLRQEFHL